MESEVRPWPWLFACFNLRSRKLLTALILYSSVASLVLLLVLNSTKTIRVFQGGRLTASLPINLTAPMRLMRDRSAAAAAASAAAAAAAANANGTDFIYSRGSRQRLAGPAAKKPGRPGAGTNTSSPAGAARGSECAISDGATNSTNSTSACRGGGAGNATAAKAETEEPSTDPLFHSVIHHYKSMIDLEPFDFHCDSCALVSSSGQLLNQRAGRQIDRHACVLRMNVAPTRGFELDVGSKTTIRTVCFVSTSALKTRASELLTGAERVLFWGLNTPKHREALGRVQTLAKMYDQEFYSLDDAGEAKAVKLFEKETGKNRAKTNSWLSTGWFTMMLAIGMCDRVDVYGMVPEDHCRKHGHRHVKYHYWQTSWGPSECEYYKANEYMQKGGHRFLTEKAIFQRWAVRYNITFHNPGWDLDRERRLGDRPINTPFMRMDANRDPRRRH